MAQTAQISQMASVSWKAKVVWILWRKKITLRVQRVRKLRTVFDHGECARCVNSLHCVNNANGEIDADSVGV